MKLRLTFRSYLLGSAFPKPCGGAAGRIQRNHAGVSWHTTLLAKSRCVMPCPLRRAKADLRKAHTSWPNSRLAAIITFAKSKATRAGSTLPVPAIANQPFCPLWSKGISLLFFAPIFRHIWHFAEISNLFYCTSPKLLCCRKKSLTFCANP